MSERQFDGFARVTASPLQGMITLRGDLSDAAFAGDVAKATGVAVPDRGLVASKDAASLAWMSPDELLMFLPHPRVAGMVATLSQALAGHHALVADVSDARAHFTVEGDLAREVLAKVTPIDMHHDAFPQGQFRRTRLAQVAGAIWCREETRFDVVCFRSVEDYVWELLTTSAETGSAPGVFT